MQYAVIQSGARQYKVKEGDVIEVARLGKTDGDVTFDKVLLVVHDGKVTVGTPTVQNMTVTGKVLGEIKGEKIRVSKYKAKVRFRRVRGFRAVLTKVQVTAIGNEKKAVKEVSEVKEKPAKKVTKTKTKAAQK